MLWDSLTHAISCPPPPTAPLRPQVTRWVVPVACFHHRLGLSIVTCALDTYRFPRCHRYGFLGGYLRTWEVNPKMQESGCHMGQLWTKRDQSQHTNSSPFLLQDGLLKYAVVSVASLKTSWETRQSTVLVLKAGIEPLKFACLPFQSHFCFCTHHPAEIGLLYIMLTLSISLKFHFLGKSDWNVYLPSHGIQGHSVSIRQQLGGR